MTELRAATRPSVLFVDDEPRILVALKAIFRNEYDVSTADSGAKALDLLRERSFDVVVSDQRMPHMNGTEVLRAARELRPRAVRMLLTGYSDLNAVVGAINEGEIFRFISKPWANAELRATVAAAVRASAVEHIDTTPSPTAPAADRSSPAGAAPAESSSLKTSVLIVDDDHAFAQSIRGGLAADRQVLIAGSVDDAIDLLERHEVGVVITELQIGGEAITPLLSALRQHRPSLVAIVVANQVDAGHSIDLINHSQVYRFLRKPVSDGILRGSVNLAMRRHEMLRSHPEQVQRIVAVAPPPPRSEHQRGWLNRIGRMLHLSRA